MDIGEKLTAIESIIYAFAANQFQANQIPPTLGRLVMEGVYAKFLEASERSILMSRVETAPGEDQAAQAQNPDTKQQTGTPEEAMEALRKTGFTPSRKGTGK